jgi:hypothetical protein
MLRPLVTIAASAALALAPVAAQAAPARVGAPVSAQSEGIVPIEGYAIGLAVFVLIIALLLSDNSHPDTPDSP